MKVASFAFCAVVAGFLAVCNRLAVADLFVSSENTNQVLRYNSTTGHFLGVFASGGGLNSPRGLVFGPDGRLYVSSGYGNQIIRYDGVTGVFKDVFISGSGLHEPEPLVFGPDHNLYVGGLGMNRVLRFDGATGAFIDEFVPGGSGGLLTSRSLRFGPDGKLYVGTRTSGVEDRILRFDAATGTFIDEFVSPSASGGLRDPLDMVFGSDGDLYVSNRYGQNILRYDGATGDLLGVFASDNMGSHPWGLEFGPGGDLFVCVHYAAQVLRYDGTTGAYIGEFVPSGLGGLSHPSHMVFHSMPGAVTLTVSSSLYGYVATPGTGVFEYDGGTVVPLQAVPSDGCSFIGWTGTAVEAGKVADSSAAQTGVTMDAPYTLRANFEIVVPDTHWTLTISSGPGGYVSAPGEGAFEYDDGTTVPVVARTLSGQRFARWTGTAVDAGKIADPHSATITLTMDGNYALVANFEAIQDFQRMLNISATSGGHVVTPGEGWFVYADGTFASVTAQADKGYAFAGWIGTAVEAGAVVNPTAASTKVRMNASYGLCATFARGSPDAMCLLSPNGGEVLASGSTLLVCWETEGMIPCINMGLSTDRGATWTGVAPCVTGGQHDWRVPIVDSNQCLMRIAADSNTAVSDISDAPFTIRTHAADGHTWYVDAAAGPAGDGTTWETAFVDLQDGLAIAADGDSVWVAAGLYWPDLGSAQTTGDRAATFQLKNGVIVCGGFPTGGSTWQQRNPFQHQSILSGNLGDPNEPKDNSYHVVSASGTDKTAILDGFTICGGFANGSEPHHQGAGLYNHRGSPEVRDCIFVGNATPSGNGGGACNIDSDATFINCVFNSNTAGSRGGGMYNRGGTVTITNCTFFANQGLWQAGGVYSLTGSTTVTNSILWGNGRSNRDVYDEMAQTDGVPKPTPDHCCIQGYAGGLGGQGNFGPDPLFVDTDGLDGTANTPDDDLRLQAGSPCIDRGSAAAVPFDVLTDLQGNPRCVGEAVDMGAYEFSAAPSPSGGD